MHFYTLSEISEKENNLLCNNVKSNEILRSIFSQRGEKSVH